MELNSEAADAVFRGAEKELDSLIARGLDLNAAGDWGRTLLHLAVTYSPPLVPRMLGQGAKPDTADRDGFTPLHFATMNQDVRTVETLMRSGASLKVQNKYGNTPLHTAVASCRNSNGGDVIKFLLAAGADPNLKNRAGVSPFEFACNVANYDIKQWFETPG